MINRPASYLSICISYHASSRCVQTCNRSKRVAVTPRALEFRSSSNCRTVHVVCGCFLYPLPNSIRTITLSQPDIQHRNKDTRAIKKRERVTKGAYICENQRKKDQIVLVCTRGMHGHGKRA